MNRRGSWSRQKKVVQCNEWKVPHILLKPFSIFGFFCLSCHTDWKIFTFLPPKNIFSPVSICLLNEAEKWNNELMNCLWMRFFFAVYRSMCLLIGEEYIYIFLPNIIEKNIIQLNIRLKSMPQPLMFTDTTFHFSLLLIFRIYDFFHHHHRFVRGMKMMKNP